MIRKRCGAIAGIIIMMLLTSCFGGSRADMLTREDSAGNAQARLEQVVDAIKNKDRDAIKAMFSEQVLNDVEDLDGGIDYLFATFPNGIDSWDKIGGSEKGSRRYGSRTARRSYSYNVYAGDAHYVLAIVEQTVETEHPEKIGMHSIVTWISNEKMPDFRYPTAGIYVPEEFSSN